MFGAPTCSSQIWQVFGAPKLSSKKGAEETRSKEDHFVVKHFAGDVVYNSG